MRSFEGWFFNRWVQLAAAFVPGLTYFAWGRHFSDLSRGCSSSALFDHEVSVSPVSVAGVHPPSLSTFTLPVSACGPLWTSKAMAPVPRAPKPTWERKGLAK